MIHAQLSDLQANARKAVNIVTALKETNRCSWVLDELEEATDELLATIDQIIDGGEV